MHLPTWVLCNSNIIILYDILLPMMINSLSFDKVENSFIVEQHMFNIIPLFHQYIYYSSRYPPPPQKNNID